MTDHDAQNLRETVLSLWRMIHDLQSGHDALLQIVTETYSAKEALEFFRKYEARKSELSEKLLLKVEASFPNLAAELDKNRPLLPPDEEEDGAGR
jgi:hypothetical protein